MPFEQFIIFILVISGSIYIPYTLFNLQNNNSELLFSTKNIKKPFIIRIAKSIFFITFIAFFFRSFIYEPYNIPSESMLPNYKKGDLIIIDKFSNGVKLPVSGKTIIKTSTPLERNDVIVFRKKINGTNKVFIKRIVGMPNELVEYKNKTLFINRIAIVNNNYKTLINSEQKSIKYDFNKLKLPSNSYYVLGDNRDNSLDSRFFGFIKEEDILGKVKLTWANIDWANKKFTLASK